MRSPKEITDNKIIKHMIKDATVNMRSYVEYCISEFESGTPNNHEH